MPISITVFNQEQLDKRNILSGNDLAAYTPSLAVNTRFGSDYASFSLRGFFQENRTTASVAAYFADVVAPRGGGSTQGGDGAGPGSFFDLQNVQVLKGPQGTLFGRNTTGGAILLVPRKPTDKVEGYLEGGLGNYNLRRGQGVINLPLSEHIRFRAGADWQERDGYLKNISGIGPKDFANSKYFAARASLVIDVSPDIENYTVFSYANSTPNGSIPKITNCYENAVAGVALTAPGGLPPNVGGIRVGQLACQQLARVNIGWNVVENSLTNPQQHHRQWQAINTTTWKVSDNLTIKNIVSYSELKDRQRVDLFGARYTLPATVGFVVTNPAAPNFGATSTLDLAALGLSSFIGQSFGFVAIDSIPGSFSNAQSTFSEELQFQGDSADGRLKWQAGGYFEKSSPLGLAGNLTPTLLDCTAGALQCIDYVGTILKARAGLPLTSTLVGVGSMNYQGAETTFRNIGLYAQADYDLTDQLTFTAGFRYTWDKTTTIADRATFRFFSPNVPTGTCTNPVVRPASNPLPSVSATDLCRVPQTAVPDFNFTAEQISKAPTWLIGFDYKPVEDVMLYTKWSRGYRQGATQPFGPDGLPPFKQEKVDTYEVGAKTAFRGAVSGTFNIAGFYNDFRNYQISASYAAPRITGSAPNTGVVNAPKARIYGFEAEAVIIPAQGLRLQAAYAYLNSKILGLDTLPEVPAFFPGRHLTAVGFELPYTPRHKFTLDASYTLPLDESIGEITLGTTYSYISRQFYQGPSTAAAAAFLGPAPQSEIYNIPGYGLWNLNATWNKIAGSDVDLAFFMTNVANKHYYLARNLQATSGFVSHYVAEPRMLGFKLRYSFGN